MTDKDKEIQALAESDAIGSIIWGGLPALGLGLMIGPIMAGFFSGLLFAIGCGLVGWFALFSGYYVRNRRGWLKRKADGGATT